MKNRETCLRCSAGEASGASRSSEGMLLSSSFSRFSYSLFSHFFDPSFSRFLNFLFHRFLISALDVDFSLPIRFIRWPFWVKRLRCLRLSSLWCI